MRNNLLRATGIVALLLALIRCCDSQTCETFAGFPTTCAGIIDYPVWVPPGLTQANLSVAFIQQGILASSIYPRSCAELIAVAACSTFFRACGVDFLPLPLCPELCALGQQQCAGTPFVALFNSSAVDPVLSGPLWVREVNRSGVVQECVLANATTPNVVCTSPFIYNPNVDQCVIKCPPTGLDDAYENRRTILTQAILGIFCIIAIMIIIVPIWFNRKFVGIIHFEITSLIASIGDVIPKWYGANKLMCSDAWTLRTSSSSSCLFSAFTGIWARQAVAYSAMVTMHVLLEGLPGFARLRLFEYPDALIPQVSRTLGFSLIIYGFPTLQFCIAWFNGWIDSSSGPYGCSVNAAVHGGWASNGLTLIPLTIVASITTVEIVLILRYLFKNGWSAVKTQLPLTSLVTYYMLVVWYIIIFAWNTFRIRDEITQRIVDYISCTLATGGAPGLCAPYKSAINIGWQLSVIIATSSYAIVLFFPFLYNSYKFYSNCIKAGGIIISSSEANVAGSGSYKTDRISSRDGL